MRTFIVFLFIISILFSIGYSQEKIDVIYLKNGDVRKGTVIENVPNDYIKIETTDGSIFTIKYADIEKMTKEIKPVTQQSSTIQSVKNGLMSRTGEFGVTAGLWLSGDINFEHYGDFSKKTGFLLRVFYDAYVAEKFAVGAYVNFSPMSWEYDNRGSTMFEVGCALKPRFPIADGAAAIKPGLNIGYRAFSSKSVQSDKVNALAINMSIEIQFQTKSTVVPFFEFGFLAEPVGGNDLTKITFPPIIYFGGGVAF